MGIMLVITSQCGHPGCGTRVFRHQSVWDVKGYGPPGMVCRNGHLMTGMKRTMGILYREDRRR